MAVVEFVIPTVVNDPVNVPPDNFKYDDMPEIVWYVDAAFVMVK